MLIPIPVKNGPLGYFNIDLPVSLFKNDAEWDNLQRILQAYRDTFTETPAPKPEPVPVHELPKAEPSQPESRAAKWWRNATPAQREARKKAMKEGIRKRHQAKKEQASEPESNVQKMHISPSQDNHKHSWRLDSPNGPVSKGHCQVVGCDAVKEFPNSSYAEAHSFNGRDMRAKV